MKPLRLLSLVLMAVLVALSMVACGEDASASKITVTVNATDINGDPVVLGDVTYESENPTVLEALEAICQDREFALEVDDLTGIVTKIGDVGVSTYVDEKTGVNMAIGWTWKLNGEELKSLAKETAIKSGDKIEYYQYAYENVEDTWVDPDAETTSN